ncbi:MAG: YHS domain-containing protein [Candidatus Omnitrophica bacterium]|nr:YHS domain-containing protein [Candidatus Omnitrophota bacterium]
MGNKKDPVCGNEITEEKSCVEHQGKHYCFCSDKCKQEFQNQPEKYTKEEGQGGGSCGCH